MTVEEYPDHDTARWHEDWAIFLEKPLHNKVGNPRFGRAPEYLSKECPCMSQVYFNWKREGFKGFDIPEDG